MVQLKKLMTFCYIFRLNLLLLQSFLIWSLLFPAGGELLISVLLTLNSLPLFCYYTLTYPCMPDFSQIVETDLHNLICTC